MLRYVRIAAINGMCNDMTLRDLTGKEIELLISYRLMTDEEKRQTLELMKQLAADRENLN